MPIILFALGAAVGSFLNVVSLRYSSAGPILGKQLLGRSCCPGCRRSLRWFELVPIFSFVFLRGRCRTCKKRISLQYPLTEILSGLIFVFVPAGLGGQINPAGSAWLLIFETLLLIGLIDLRLHIIPDEANILLLILGILLAFWGRFDPPHDAFIGFYAMLFGTWKNIWLNRLVAAGFAATFFGFLILATKGKGMGMGDLKLAVPLAVVFGWPDMLIITALAFIFGSLLGGYTLLFRRGTLKSAVPFGPFLALASVTVFFFGQDILNWYFGLFRG